MKTAFVSLKRTICLLISGALLLSLIACGNSGMEAVDTPAEQQSEGNPTENLETTDDSDTQSASTIEEPSASQETDAAQSGDQILIAYFTAAENSNVDAVASASVVTIDGIAKGRVQAVAEMIQSETGGDLFSIQTLTEYPGDGRDLIDFAAEEQDADIRPELTTHIENLNDYDVVFVGYPNWWYDMPMALYSFFEEYDFSGKTIVPFNVHNGSRFSSTIETIQELEPDANVIADGFTVSERDVADAAGDVAQWLDDLGYSLGGRQ
ncbi:MAG: flavodoxin [Candidatus Onthomonas sp.]